MGRKDKSPAEAFVNRETRQVNIAAVYTHTPANRGHKIYKCACAACTSLYESTDFSFIIDTISGI